MAEEHYIQGALPTEHSGPLARTDIAVAALANGGYVNVWQEGGGAGADTMAQIFADDGTPLGIPFRANPTLFNEQSDPEVVGLTGGGFVVAYSSDVGNGDTDIAFQRYTDAGVAVGSETVANTTTAGDQSEVSMIQLANGGFALAWQTALDNGDGTATTEVRVQRYDSTGTTVGSEILVSTITGASDTGGGVNEYDYLTPDITEMTGGNLVVGWNFRTLPPPWTSQLAVIDGTGAIVSGPTDPQQTADDPFGDSFTEVVALGNNTFLAAWIYSFGGTGATGVGYGQVYGRIYDASGTPVGNEFVIAGGTQSRRFQLEVEPDGKGGANVLYGQEEDAGTDNVVLLQNISQNGQLQGDPIWVDRYDPGSNLRIPTMATLANGDIITVTQVGNSSSPLQNLKHRLLYDGEDARFSTGFETVTLNNSGETIAAGSGDGTVIGGSGDDVIGGGAGEDDLSGNGGDDLIDGGADDDTISGGADADTIFGGGGIDTIDGDGGADWIEGGAGDDIIDGGDDNDIIYGGGGSDTIEGGEGDDEIFGHRGLTSAGSFGAPSLLPLSPFETDYDETSVNTLSGGIGNDRINGGDGVDIIDGGADDDSLYGHGGQNVITGGTGRDTMVGGADDDTFIVNDGDLGFGSETISGNGGFDKIVFQGGAGTVIDDIGGTVIRTMEALEFGAIAAGGDRTVTFFTDRFGSTRLALDAEIIGHDVAGSTETLDITLSFVPDFDFSGLQFTDWGGQNELVRLSTFNGFDSEITGTSVDDIIDVKDGADTVYGLGGDDIIFGGIGADVLDGGTGLDTLIGGADNDIYYVDQQTDIVVENAGEGTDFIYTSSSYQLALHAERLIAIEGEAGAFGLTARNFYNNIIMGNSDTNVFIDQFGRDTFVGGGGSDYFRFIANLDPVNNVNRINDFDSADDQFQLLQLVYSEIDVGILDASEFVLGTAAGDANDRIIYDSSNGVLYYDPDGTGSTAQIEIVNVVAGTTITADDFQIF